MDDNDIKRISAAGMASMFLQAELIMHLVNTGRLSREETREMVDRAILAVEESLGGNIDPVLCEATCRFLESFLDDFRQSLNSGAIAPCGGPLDQSQ